MSSVVQKLVSLLKKLIAILIVLALSYFGFVYFDKIATYAIHGQSFYYVHLGDKEYKKQNYQEAIDYYRRALELYPKHHKARYNLANIYVAYEDYESAVGEYKTVLKYKPDYLNARISLGILFAEEFLEFDKAVKQYEEAAKTPVQFIKIPFLYDNREHVINSKAIAYYNMGLAYRDKSMLYESGSKEFKELLLHAIESYKKSLEVNPDNYDALFNLGLTAHILGMYSEALTGYCKAMLVAPLNYEAHFNLAVLLKQKNLYKESFYELKDAGSLMVYTGDTFHASQIYGMLAEVSSMAIAEYGFEPKNLINRLDSEVDVAAPSPDEAVTVSELENAIRKRIKTASVCRNYLKGE